jgi:hypothetical protein
MVAIVRAYAPNQIWVFIVYGVATLAKLALPYYAVRHSFFVVALDGFAINQRHAFVQKKELIADFNAKLSEVVYNPLDVLGFKFIFHFGFILGCDLKIDHY